MKYFKNLKVGTIEAVENKDVIAQMEAYPEVYEEVEAPKAPKAKKAEKAEKVEKAEKAEEAEAPKAEAKK